MGVVAVASVRSAGVSTTVAALTAVWPRGRRLLLLEADPAGGTLAACWGLAGAPGLVSLAAAARRQSDPELVWAHTQPTPYGGGVMPGPVAAEQARAALAMAGGVLARLEELDADVLVDCGRLDPGAPAAGLFAGADVAVLVTRPQLPDLHVAADWLDRSRPPATQMGLVLVGPAAFTAADVAATLNVEVLVCLPHDPTGVGALSAVPSRGWRRSPLARSARVLAEALATRLPVSRRQESAGDAAANAAAATDDDGQQQHRSAATSDSSPPRERTPTAPAAAKAAVPR